MIIHDHKFSVTRQDRFTSLFSFYFAEKGYLDLNVTISPYISHPVTLMFCSDKELEPLRSSYITFESVCKELPLGLCSKEITVSPMTFDNDIQAIPSLLLSEYDKAAGVSTRTVLSFNPTSSPIPVPLDWAASAGPYLPPTPGAANPIDLSAAETDPFAGTTGFTSLARTLAASAAPEFQANEVDLRVLYENNVPTRDRYRLLQLNCPEMDYEGRLSHVAINPGGEYLSLTYVPYKSMYRISLFVFSVLLVLWLLHLHRHRSLNIRAQQLLLAVPASKILLALVADRYWNIASETGVAPASFYWLSFGALLVARGAVFFIALTLATGYGFLHGNVPRMFSSRIALLVGAYLFAYALLQLDFGMALLLTVVNYAFVWQLFSLLVAFTLRDVAQQIDALHRHQFNFVMTPLYPKLLMLQRIQPAFVTFVVVDLFCSLWGSVAYATAPWLQDAADHVASGLLTILLMRALALRPFNAHLHTMAALMNKTLSAQLHAAVAQELATRITPATHGYHTHDNPRITALLPPVETSDAMMLQPGLPVPSPLPGELLRHVRGEAPNKRRYGHCLVHNACQCPCEDTGSSTSGRGDLARNFLSRCCGHASMAMLFARVAETSLQGAHMSAVSSQRLASHDSGEGKSRTVGTDGVDHHGVIVGCAAYQDVALHPQDQAYAGPALSVASPAAVGSPRWGASRYSRLTDE